MARDDNAVLKISGGYFYRAAVGTAAPADLTAPGLDWTEIGHTSLESILAFASDGGDATTLGTLQAPVLRTTYSTRTETMNFPLQQFDEESLKLYFGSNMVDADPVANPGKWLGVPKNPAPTESAFLVALFDGTRGFGIWVPKAELFRGDDASLDDTESLASLPINVTPLVYGTNEFTYALTPLATTP